MGLFFKKNETKEANETKETKNENTEKNNEYVSEFDKRYAYDVEKGQYRYKEGEEYSKKAYGDRPDETKTAEKKSDAADDDDEMDDTIEHKKPKEKEDDGDER